MVKKPINISKNRLIQIPQPTIRDCVEMQDYLERLDLNAPNYAAALFKKAKIYGYVEPPYFGETGTEKETKTTNLWYLFWAILGGLILAAAVMFFTSCGQPPRTKPTAARQRCNYMVVHNTKPDTLAYIPKTILGDYDYAAAEILLPYAYKQIRLYTYGDTINAYVLNDDLPQLCSWEGEPLLMDGSNLYPYRTAKPVLEKYAKIKQVMASADTTYQKTLLRKW